MGKLGPDKKAVTITIDKKVWSDFQAFCKTLHLSASQAVEIIARAQVMMGSAGMEHMMKGIFSDMIKADRSLSPDVKEMIQGALDEP